MRKKRNKKALAAVLLMAILVTGCSKPETNSTNNNKKDTVNETKKEVEKQEEETKVSYQQGVRTDTTYENKGLNIKFTLPEGFAMATPEEMKEMLGEGLDVQNLTEAQLKAADQALQEMVAYSETDGSSVTIVAEKVPLASITEEQFLQMSIDAAVNANESGEMQIQAFGEIAEEQLGGQSLKKGAMRTTTEGIVLIQELYMKVVGDYVVVIGLSYLEGNEAAKNTMTAAFQPAA